MWIKRLVQLSKAGSHGSLQRLSTSASVLAVASLSRSSSNPLRLHRSEAVLGERYGYRREALSDREGQCS